MLVELLRHLYRLFITTWSQEVNMCLNLPHLSCSSFMLLSQHDAKEMASMSKELSVSCHSCVKHYISGTGKAAYLFFHLRRGI